ncbi:MAG: CPBP family intramembrane metalloprotease [Acidobacteriota bacterium]|nr:CPBP family intramembrane metalloprotease [Acidobacteriota bacterium]
MQQPGEPSIPTGAGFTPVPPVAAPPGGGGGPAAGPPSGPGRRPRWYAIGDDPPLEPVGTRRAYTEVLLVYLAFFAAGIVAAALLLGNRGSDLANRGSWGVYMPAAVNVVAEIGLAVAVVLLLSSRRGVSPAALGLRVGRHRDGRVNISQSIRIMGWCFLAIIVGGVINAALQSGSLPPFKDNAPSLIYAMFDSLQAGVVEEMVVLAFVVVTLRQARRPWWEITVVALVLRGAYHVYYGPGVLGILVWAALFYWIYLRFRQLWPLIVCHALWDMVAFLSRPAPAVAGVGVLAVLALWVTSIILWLVARSERSGRSGPPANGWPADATAPWLPGGPLPGPGRPPRVDWPAQRYPGVTPRPADARRADGHPGVGPGPVQEVPAVVPGPAHPGQLPAGVAAGGPPPGWHPDPAGHNRWRWWDGQRWTDHVSGH